MSGSGTPGGIVQAAQERGGREQIGSDGTVPQKRPRLRKGLYVFCM